MKTGAQSHSDVDRIQFGIGTHQYYMSKHHTAKHAKGKYMYITVIVMKGMNDESCKFKPKKLCTIESCYIS